jgi:hypothetical protein
LAVPVAEQQRPFQPDTMLPLANKATDSNGEKLGFVRLSLFFQVVARRPEELLIRPAWQYQIAIFAPVSVLGTS